MTRETDATMTAEADIRQLLQDWASATRQGRQDDVLLKHAPNALIYDVPPPMKYDGTDVYRRSWGDWQPQTPLDGQFALEDLSVTTGAEVAFANGFIRCGGRCPTVALSRTSSVQPSA